MKHCTDLFVLLLLFFQLSLGPELKTKPTFLSLLKVCINLVHSCSPSFRTQLLGGGGGVEYCFGKRLSEQEEKSLEESDTGHH